MKTARGIVSDYFHKSVTEGGISTPVMGPNGNFAQAVDDMYLLYDSDGFCRDETAHEDIALTYIGLLPAIWETNVNEVKSC